MRPQQQNRRMRGRGGGGGNNNNNRKGPNPLTRSYESNGPDVKIRGTAQQVAEKYAALARDAHSSGDRVMAENYLQHAEHYNRIIAAALAQQQQFQQQRDTQDDFDGDDEDRPERETRQPEAQPQQYHVNGFGPQPVIDDAAAPAAFDAVSGDGAKAAEQQAGGNGQQRAESEEGGPRRGRRPRRQLRGKQEQAEGGEAATEAEAPPTPEAAE
jgi:hypothetical protein